MENHIKKENNSAGKSSMDKTFMQYLHDIVYLLCAVLILFLLVFRIVIVSGPSMMDTLVDGDYVLLLNNVLSGDPEYGDIVVISKHDYSDGEPIVKRVIATAGDTVDIDFEAGVVYVNGQALDEPYTRTPTNLKEGTQFPLTVPEGCIFVMGDNRNKSLDSRSTQIGIVDCREVLGEAVFLVLPGTDGGNQPMDFDRFGGI